MDEDNFNYDSKEELLEFIKEESVTSLYDDNITDEYMYFVVLPKINAFDCTEYDFNSNFFEGTDMNCYLTFHKKNGVVHQKVFVLFDDMTFLELNVTEDGKLKFDVGD